MPVASSGKRYVKVWRPSVRLSVCTVGILTVTHQGDATRHDNEFVIFRFSTTENVNFSYVTIQLLRNNCTRFLRQFLAQKIQPNPTNRPIETRKHQNKPCSSCQLMSEFYRDHL